MQEGIADLEEDTRQKLTQTWDALTKGLEDAQADLAAAQHELTQSDRSVVELTRALGARVDALAMTELPEVAARVEEVASGAAQEQEELRTYVEGALEVRATDAAITLLLSVVGRLWCGCRRSV